MYFFLFACAIFFLLFIFHTIFLMLFIFFFIYITMYFHLFNHQIIHILFYFTHFTSLLFSFLSIFFIFFCSCQCIYVIRSFWLSILNNVVGSFLCFYFFDNDMGTSVHYQFLYLILFIYLSDFRSSLFFFF